MGAFRMRLRSYSRLVVPLLLALGLSVAPGCPNSMDADAGSDAGAGDDGDVDDDGEGPGDTDRAGDSDGTGDDDEYDCSPGSAGCFCGPGGSCDGELVCIRGAWLGARCGTADEDEPLDAGAVDDGGGAPTDAAGDAGADSGIRPGASGDGGIGAGGGMTRADAGDQ